MNSNLKLAAIALTASLLGGSAGAVISSRQSEPVQALQAPALASFKTQVPGQAVGEIPEIQAYGMYPDGVLPEGYVPASAVVATPAAPARATAPQRVYYTYSNPTPRSQPASSTYVYRQENKPSFWQRHRDILTVGIGTGVGAAIGGATGGKKGALIGAAAGAGGSALYTYKIRKH